MKVTVPIEVEVNLTGEQRIACLKEWVYKWLKEIEPQGSDYYNSKVIVKEDKLYWQYQRSYPTLHGNVLGDFQYKYIPIKDNELLLKFYKSAVETINTYYNIKEIKNQGAQNE